MRSSKKAAWLFWPAAWSSYSSPNFIFTRRGKSLFVTIRRRWPSYKQLLKARKDIYDVSGVQLANIDVKKPDAYMRGLYNGLELALALLDNKGYAPMDSRGDFINTALEVPNAAEPI